MSFYRNVGLDSKYIDLIKNISNYKMWTDIGDMTILDTAIKNLHVRIDIDAGTVKLYLRTEDEKDVHGNYIYEYVVSIPLLQRTFLNKYKEYIEKYPEVDINSVRLLMESFDTYVGLCVDFAHDNYSRFRIFIYVQKVGDKYRFAKCKTTSFMMKDGWDKDTKGQWRAYDIEEIKLGDVEKKMEKI